MNNLSILLLAADSGEGPLGDMIDPELRESWRAAGIHTSACYFSDLRREHLENTHVVILLRTPLPGDVDSDFAAKSEWVRDFVARGGGLLSLFTECYGKSESTLNELFLPWGLRFYFNRLVAQAGVVVERFPRFFEGVILPAGGPSGDLGLSTEGGHGTQHLTCVGDARWEAMLRGGARVVSEPYKGAYLNCSEAAIPDPVLAARAEIGAGRVVAFPGSVPFWIVNPFIWRFDGLLHKQREGAGGKFLLDAVRWLADTERGRVLEPNVKDLPDPACLTKAQVFSFRRVSDTQQLALREAKPQRVWIGAGEYAPMPSLSGVAVGEGPNPLRFGPITQEDGRHVARTRRCHPSLCLPLIEYGQLSETTWPAYRQSGRDASTPECRVEPGYELLDEEGAFIAVVSPEAFPKHELRYPNSTLLENVMIPHPGCLSILRTPLQNRIPAQRYGGYNLIEWEEGEEWVDLYRRLVASKYFIAPIAFAGAETWSLVPPGSNAFDQMRHNRHSTFVTTGPRLETFTWEGPGLTDDDWEGYWYGYRPGDEAVVHLRVVADAPLVAVALPVTARDANGRELLATYPLYTRNLEFWGHVGSDQMNNYVGRRGPSKNAGSSPGYSFLSFLFSVVAACGDLPVLCLASRDLMAQGLTDLDAKAVAAYVDCGSLSDQPFSAERGYGYLDKYSWPVRWYDAELLHVTAANARGFDAKPLTYRFTGLSTGLSYRIGFLRWAWQAEGSREVSVWSQTLPVPRYDQGQGPLFQTLEVPKKEITDVGTLEVTFARGEGGTGTYASVGELWLFAEGGPTNQTAEELRERFQSPAQAVSEPLTEHPLHAGLIGARSTLSGGSATVAELAQAAREAGLDFLAFNEDSERLGADGLRVLQEACTAASTGTFRALPGVVFSGRYAEERVRRADTPASWGEVRGSTFAPLRQLPTKEETDNAYTLFWKFFGGEYGGGAAAVPTIW